MSEERPPMARVDLANGTYVVVDGTANDWWRKWMNQPVGESGWIKVPLANKKRREAWIKKNEIVAVWDF